MNLKTIVQKLELQLLTAEVQPDTEVTGAYTSDLLSDVIAHSTAGNLWITLQIHQNIVAVAKLKDLAGIILVNGREPEKETLRKATEENIPLLQTADTAFTISGKLYQLMKQEG
jgi:predicted transcriptional regulator